MSVKTIWMVVLLLTFERFVLTGEGSSVPASFAILRMCFAFFSCFSPAPLTLVNSLQGLHSYEVSSTPNLSKKDCQCFTL